MAEEKKEELNKPVKKVETKGDSPKRIYRSKSDRMIAGVCGGFAQYFNFDTTIIRVLWAVAIFWGGVGLIAYILSWIIIPENPGTENVSDKTKTNSKNTGLIWGLILIAIGGLFLVRQLDWFNFYPFHFRWHWGPWWFGNVRFDVLLPILIILIGVIYLVSVLRKENQTKGSPDEKSSGGKKMEKKLTRSVKDRMIGGVCGGLAVYFNIDPSIVRVGWALLTLAGGGFIGLVAYIVMLIVVPEENVIESSSSGAKAASSKSQTK
ncbi:MAG: PspC domain-containing protein [bacterium]